MKHKLTPEHLSPYLPYGLKANLGKDIISIIGVSQKSIQVESEYTHYGYSDVRITDIKPILRPLSDMTKPITYKYNGLFFKDFVFTELFEIGDTAGYDFEFDHGNIKLIKNLESISKHNCHHDISYLPHQVVKEMYANLFDVFGLIEEGLAVDVNTLESNPYEK